MSDLSASELEGNVAFPSDNSQMPCRHVKFREILTFCEERNKERRFLDGYK